MAEASADVKDLPVAEGKKREEKKKKEPKPAKEKKPQQAKKKVSLPRRQESIWWRTVCLHGCRLRALR